MDRMKRCDLQITGMTCAACANRIEKVLKRANGIINANVNYAIERASITYNPGSTSLPEIEKKIESLGYGTVTAEKEKQKEREIRQLTYRFFFSLVLSFPLVWGMAAHFQWLSFIGVPKLFVNPWFQLALTTPIQLIIARPFYEGAFKALKNKTSNMDVLVVLSTSAAYLYSHYITVSTLGTNTADLYYETSALIITFLLLGKLLEAKTKQRTTRAITKLYRLKEKKAVVLRNHEEMSIPVEQVEVGDLLKIRPGERIPLDGQVMKGVSTVNESMVTGESIPTDKKPGNFVIGGTMNQNGLLLIRVEKVGQDTMLAQIIKIVEEAQGSKAPIQRLADQLTELFVPIIVAVATITFFAWYMLLAPDDFANALEKSITVLIIACPCALGLATPTSIMVGSGRAAELGILFKEGKHLEELEKMDTVILDKTGTLTKGNPELTDIYIHQFDEISFLKTVGAAEKESEHPIAQAIFQAIASKKLKWPTLADFQEIPGHGIRATVDKKKVLIGTYKFLSQEEIKLDITLKKIRKLENEGKTVILVAIEGKFAGLFAVADQLKGNANKAVRRLKKLGLHVIMMTGDNERTAKAIAKQAGINSFYAGVLPYDKAKVIHSLQKKGKKVMMVGDGINDAPALAVANIGMAMGTGTDIAAEAGDVILIRGNLPGIADAFQMSKKTMKIIKQNLFWALIYNITLIPVAMIGLLAPWAAAAAMSFSSLSVVLNALRLQKRTT